MVVHVLEFPDMRREPGALLVAVPTVALVLADPLPHRAVLLPGVGLLLPGAELVDILCLLVCKK